MMLLVLGFFFALTDVQGVDVEDYLKKFGYIPRPNPHAASSDDPDQMENGIKKFQEYHGLNQTGIIDQPLMDIIVTPRCGNADIENSRQKRYTTAGQKWRKRNLQYAIAKYHSSDRVTHDNINDVVKSAFSLWQSVADLNLTKVDNSRTADLRVSFLTGSHSTLRTRHMNSRLSFDGPGGVLAHASFPTVGEIHFDDSEHWLLEGLHNEGQIGYNLKWAAVHELGHALGLKHSRVKNSIMNPLYKSRNILNLNVDDIKGIQRLYGKPRVRVATQAPTYKRRKLMIENDVENKCRFTNFSAMLTHNNKMYGFNKDKVWILSMKGQNAQPHNISTIFPGIHGPIHAVMSGINNKIYFFRSGFYWRWDSSKRAVDRGFPRRVAALGRIYTNIIAAFRWGLNGKGYLFGAHQYWRYDFHKQKVDPGYPRSIQTWRGIPATFQSITTAPNKITYIFDNQNYWIYNDTEFRVKPVKYSIANKWKACSPPDPISNESTNNNADRDYFDEHNNNIANLTSAASVESLSHHVFLPLLLFLFS